MHNSVGRQRYWRRVRLSSVASMVIFSACSAQSEGVRLTYIGNSFNRFGTLYLNANYQRPYSTDNQLTLAINLADSEINDRVVTLNDSLAWRASDGFRLYSNSNAVIQGTLNILDNKFVTGWDLNIQIYALPNPTVDTGYLVESCGFSPCISSIAYGADGDYPRYSGEYAQTTNNVLGDYYAASTSPGVWTASTAPEPSIWTMMFVGFGIIGGIRRRRTHRALSPPDTRYAPNAAVRSDWSRAVLSPSR